MMAGLATRISLNSCHGTTINFDTHCQINICQMSCLHSLGPYHNNYYSRQYFQLYVMVAIVYFTSNWSWVFIITLCTSYFVVRAKKDFSCTDRNFAANFNSAHPWVRNGSLGWEHLHGLPPHSLDVCSPCVSKGSGNITHIVKSTSHLHSHCMWFFPLNPRLL